MIDAFIDRWGLFFSVAEFIQTDDSTIHLIAFVKAIVRTIASLSHRNASSIIARKLKLRIALDILRNIIIKGYY